MAGLNLEKGTVVDIKNRKYECGGRGPGGSYLLAPLKGRSNIYMSPEQLFDEIKNNNLRIVVDNEYIGEPLPTSYFDLDAIPKKERKLVLMRQFYMRELEVYRSEGGKLSDNALRVFAADTHLKYKKTLKSKKQKKKLKTMSGSAIRRWFRAWSESGFNIKSLVHDAKGNTHSKLTYKQQEFIERAIKEDYLDKRRLTAQHVHKLMDARISLANRTLGLTGDDEIKTPHYNTLLAHIKRVDLFDILKARYNAQYALKVTREYGITPPVNRHLERMQVDHTQVDIYVDFGKNRLVRPWLTMLLDSHSKAIQGFWLTPDPASAESVMQALRVALLPKDLVLIGGEPEWSWLMHGIPSELTLDNGKEFHGIDLDMAAAELGICLTSTPPRKPYYKAQVERKFRTVNQSLLSQLKGQVFKYEPEKHGLDYPHLTFDEFNKIFLQWVTTVLHRTPNKEGFTPEELWSNSVQKYGIPGDGLPKDYIRKCLSKSGRDSKIHPNGIRFNSLTYNNDWLSRLRNNLTNENNTIKPSVKFKWSASNVGLIWVLDPYTKKYFPVKSKETYAHNRSLYNHKVVLREQRNRKKAKMSDDKYLDAVLALDNDIKQIVDKKIIRNKRLGAKVVRYERGKPDSHSKTCTKDEVLENSETELSTTEARNQIVNISNDEFEYFPDDLEI